VKITIDMLMHDAAPGADHGAAPPLAAQVLPPSSSGAIMPSDPMQLMRQLRAAAKAGDTHGTPLTKGGDARFKRQEQQREQVECRLMEFEDYTHKKEGLYRSKALENRIQM
jgi:hypothetical protein